MHLNENNWIVFSCFQTFHLSCWFRIQIQIFTCKLSLTKPTGDLSTSLTEISQKVFDGWSDSTICWNILNFKRWMCTKRPETWLTVYVHLQDEASSRHRLIIVQHFGLHLNTFRGNSVPTVGAASHASVEVTTGSGGPEAACSAVDSQSCWFWTNGHSLCYLCQLCRNVSNTLRSIQSFCLLHLSCEKNDERLAANLAVRGHRRLLCCRKIFEPWARRARREGGSHRLLVLSVICLTHVEDVMDPEAPGWSVHQQTPTISVSISVTALLSPASAGSDCSMTWEGVRVFLHANICLC